MTDDFGIGVWGEDEGASYGGDLIDLAGVQDGAGSDVGMGAEFEGEAADAFKGVRRIEGDLNPTEAGLEEGLAHGHDFVGLDASEDGHERQV